MMNAFRPHRPLKPKRLLSRSILVSLLSTYCLVLGIIPSVQSFPVGLSFSRVAYADDVSDQEIEEYARSVLAIEPIRQQVYNSIKSKVGYVPAIECHKPSSLNQLDPSIRQDAINYCNQAIAIVERNNLTISRFNAITVAHQSDQSLLNRIQAALQRLQ